MSPDELRETIYRLLREQAKGPDAHYEAELKAERAEDAYQAALDAAFLTAEGNIEERKAIARQRTMSERDAAGIARAEHNRIKLKMRQLDSSLIAYQALLKSTMAELT